MTKPANMNNTTTSNEDIPLPMPIRSKKMARSNKQKCKYGSKCKGYQDMPSLIQDQYDQYDADQAAV